MSRGRRTSSELSPESATRSDAPTSTRVLLSNAVADLPIRRFPSLPFRLFGGFADDVPAPETYVELDFFISRFVVFFREALSSSFRRLLLSLSSRLSCSSSISLASESLSDRSSLLLLLEGLSIVACVFDRSNRLSPTAGDRDLSLRVAAVPRFDATYSRWNLLCASSLLSCLSWAVSSGSEAAPSKCESWLRLVDSFFLSFPNLAVAALGIFDLTPDFTGVGGTNLAAWLRSSSMDRSDLYSMDEVSTGLGAS